MVFNSLKKNLRALCCLGIATNVLISFDNVAKLLLVVSWSIDNINCFSLASYSPKTRCIFKGAKTWIKRILKNALFILIICNPSKEGQIVLQIIDKNRDLIIISHGSFGKSCANITNVIDHWIFLSNIS